MTKPILGKTAVYRLYDSNGTLLYVGLGSDPESRWKGHAKEKPWWAQVSKKTVTWHDSLDMASRAEHEAIHSEEPVHNKARWQWSHQSRSQETPADISAIPLGLFRKNITDRVETAHFNDEPTVVTKNGRPRAVLVPVDWYEKAVEALRSTEK